MNKYFKKYLKYKNKYLLLQKGGTPKITFIKIVTNETLLECDPETMEPLENYYIPIN